ncbi:MAG: glycogen/starch synthase [Dehalococcoidia bacterium]|nr:glycogen/starch synthase [Dehalococcoidia bacterium]
MKVLFAATEVSPLAKVGGLADVAGALPGALSKLGIEVRVAMPWYGSIDLAKHGPANPVAQYDISVFGRMEHIQVSQVSLKDGTIVYLVGNQTYFGRPAVYGEKDDLERFVLFSMAVAELPGRVGWMPDLVHCHDWHTGLVPVLWRRKRTGGHNSITSASVFTIHNLGYQGWFDDSFASRAGLQEFLPPASDSLRSKVYSLMGLAILAADSISTVSPTYAKEILTQEYGFNLETALQRRQADLYGILNGIDYGEFNPSTDALIPARYDFDSLDEKAKNKVALQEKGGLAKLPGAPLAGMVGRLADQKGLDLVAAALEPVLNQTDMQFVLLGSGEEKYRAALDKLSAKYPGRMCLFQGFNLPLAQLIYAGCDLFVMPSRYEPCGLGQLIALRYGTIPVVRQTGGLADSIQDCSPDLARGDGFVFKEYQADKLIEALKRAANGYSIKKAAWKKLVERAMKADFSWNVSAKKYVEMYENAVRKARS